MQTNQQIKPVRHQTPRCGFVRRQFYAQSAGAAALHHDDAHDPVGHLRAEEELGERRHVHEDVVGPEGDADDLDLVAREDERIGVDAPAIGVEV